jgi:uncharacterized protein (TIGR03437 family)
MSAQPEWRHVGNSAIDLGLAGLASGPVDRVWFTPDGSKLLIRTASGKSFETNDFEKWTPSETSPAVAAPGPVRGLPETGAIARTPGGQTPRAYAVGQYVYRSDNGGGNWENLNAFRTPSGVMSILGDAMRDLAVSPVNEDDLAVAGAAGVFRSLDGGKTWSGLNQGLPNLTPLRLRSLPVADRGVRLELPDATVIEWQPGERTAWRTADNADALTDSRLRQVYSLQLGTRVTAVAVSGDFIYLGLSDGRIGVSANRGVAWQYFASSDAGAVTAIWVDASDPRVALASLETHAHPAGTTGVRILRTITGGGIWDNLTSDLPDSSVNGIVGDRESGAIYAATDRGVFFTRGNLSALAPATPWTRLTGLPDLRAMDVRLDAGGNQLWTAVDGYGVYATLAPHRLGDPRVVSAADFVARAVAPGGLVSVLGAKLNSAASANLNVPVLAATDTESQIQIPFEARGDTLALAVESASGRRVLPGLPLRAAAPAIFVDRDGSPMLLDADSGVMLDVMRPAHSRGRIQILATGLGRVTPEWPTGAPAPIENPPQVTAKVQAWLDRSPVEVTRAVLAPGYVGFYLIEIEIPKIVNYGPAELYIEAEGQASNRVRMYVEP